jgi:hypothetical protein
MKDKKRIVHIRAVPAVKGTLVALKFFVESESNNAIVLDNHVRGEFHCSVTLVKLPSGRLANAVGQEFEIV